MEHTVEAAISKGLAGICFTDHCDPVIPEFPEETNATGYEEWARSYANIARVREQFGDQIEIFHGMELAEMTHAPETARAWAKAPDLDFILGATHIVRGYQDFYFLEYPDHDFCRKLAELYVDEAIGMAELDLADVLAHLGYFNRYMAPLGFYVDIMDYEEKLRHLFKILVQNGRGLEVNTSGLRRNPGPHFHIPELAVLKLFRACGGEVVTTGSDAHTARHVGSHIQEGQELLREAGFRYTTIFRKRKPEFIKL